MDERIYRIPRTYGAPTGYDSELSHYPNHKARLAEHLLTSRDAMTVEIACGLADQFYREIEKRGWLLSVEDAPGMDKDYGTKRGDA